MGCNCKNKVDAINQKYGDGGKSENTKVNPLLKILEIIMQIGFGIICGAIIIVMIVPMLVYIIFCIINNAIFIYNNTFKTKQITAYRTILLKSKPFN